MLTTNINKLSSKIKFDVTFSNGITETYCDISTAEFNARYKHGARITKIITQDKFTITVFNGMANISKTMVGKDVCRKYVDKMRSLGFKIVGCEAVK